MELLSLCPAIQKNFSEELFLTYKALDLWRPINPESIQELADTGYLFLFILNDENGLINIIHIGQCFAFKLYLFPIAQSISI